MTLADGTIYKGEYKQGLKDGHGVVTLADGSRLEGNYTNDLANGTFKEYDAEGTFVKECNYVNGMSR